MKLDLSRIREEQLSLEFLAKKLVEGFITGLHKSPYHGFSVEFAEHRLYNEGESTRHIDWKVFAKTDRLYTKTYEEETNLRCHILIDASSSMRYPNESEGKLAFSVYAAAALTWLLHRQRDAVAITTFSDHIMDQTPVKSTLSHVRKLFLLLNELLASRPPNKQSTDIASVVHEIANTIHRRSLVVIFSDMFSSHSDDEELFSALQHLKHNLHEVILFHVTDQSTELEFDFVERPHLFIDLESGNKVRLQPSQIKNGYRQAARNKLDTLKVKCGQLQIDFVEADIREDYNEIFNAYLIKRSKLN